MNESSEFWTEDLNEEPLTLLQAITVLKDFDRENIEDESVGIFMDKDMKRAVPVLLAALGHICCETCSHLRDRLCPECYDLSAWEMRP
jgi:hypothetical protein